MNILVQRKWFYPRCCIGELSVNGEFVCYTLEDAVREQPGVRVAHWKVPRETAIPVGIYRAAVTFSNRFKRFLPELFGVEEFTYIRIHGGNDHTNTEGCILVGMHKDGMRVHTCKPALDKVLALMRDAADAGGVVTVEVRGLPDE